MEIRIEISLRNLLLLGETKDKMVDNEETYEAYNEEREVDKVASQLENS